MTQATYIPWPPVRDVPEATLNDLESRISANARRVEEQRICGSRTKPRVPVRDTLTGETWPDSVACAAAVGAHISTIYRVTRTSEPFRGRRLEYVPAPRGGS